MGAGPLEFRRRLSPSGPPDRFRPDRSVQARPSTRHTHRRGTSPGSGPIEEMLPGADAGKPQSRGPHARLPVRSSLPGRHRPLPNGYARAGGGGAVTAGSLPRSPDRPYFRRGNVSPLACPVQLNPLSQLL